jgi:hypothetical protein
MGRTRIDGDQVQDETLTGADVLDNSLELVDISQTAKDNFQNQLLDTSAVDLNSNTIRGGIEELANRHFGKDFASDTKEASETTSGSAFNLYHQINFNVNDTSGVNKYKVEFNYFWGHNSASNDIIVQHLLDNTTNLWEMIKEPKDSGTDQRIDGTFIAYVDNLSQGSHSLELYYRPSTASRVSRMYRSTISVWRVE